MFYLIFWLTTIVNVICLAIALCLVVLAGIVHPFEKPALRIDNPFELFRLTGRLLRG